MIMFAVFGSYYFGVHMLVMLLVFLSFQVISIKIAGILSGLQREYLKLKDSRVKHLKSAINCLPMITTWCLESIIFLKVSKEREKEINKNIALFMKRSYSITLGWSSAPFSFLILLSFMFLTGIPLTYAFAVPASKMVNLLFYTTSCIPKATELMYNLKVSIERIQKFLDVEDIEPLWFDFCDEAGSRYQFIDGLGDSGMKEMNLFSTSDKPHARHIKMNDCSYSWKDPDVEQETKDKSEKKEIVSKETNNYRKELELVSTTKSFGFNHLSFEVCNRELVMIIGKVGAGKTSILYSLFNEMEDLKPLESFRILDKNCILLSQKPWILNKSIKDNIVMNRRFHEDTFYKSLKVAKLYEEVMNMEKKEETETGKKGEKLSGGQRWRLALARAHYQDKSILLVDDPLSALDNDTVDVIIEEIVNGGFKDKTRLIVSHRKELALLADRVYYMDDNRILNQIDKEAVEEYFKSVNNYSSTKVEQKQDVVETTIKKEKKIDIQDQNLKGIVNKTEGMGLKTFMKFLKIIDGTFWISSIFVVCQISSFAEPISIGYLLYWAQNFDEATKWHHLGVLSLLYSAKTVFPILRRILLIHLLQKNLTMRLHSRMLFKVLNTSLLHFHSKIPSSLILNRMSNDLSKVDQKMIDNIAIFMNLVSILTYLSVMVLFTIHWTSITFLLVFLLVNLYIQKKTIDIRRVLVRNQSGSMTPILDHLEDTVADLTSLRSMRLEAWFYHRYQKLVDIHFNNSYMLMGFNIWYNTVMSYSSLLIVQVPCYFILVYYYTHIDWNLVIVFIVLVGNLAGDLQRFLFFLTDLDTNFVDVSRCYMMDSIPYEHNKRISKEEEEAFYRYDLPAIHRMIASGAKEAREKVESVEFSEVSVRYGAESPVVLQGVNCRITFGEKVGVIGKTGSGKSTFTKVLWRYVREFEGRVLFNGVDVETMDVRKVRRAMYILSQESYILTGTIRFNVDPLEEHSDEEVRRVLEKVGFSNQGYTQQGISFELAEDGKNISMGERQLVCICRLLLSDASLIILDEITSSMDHSIDNTIMNMVYERFDGLATIIIVAHRLDSLAACGRVIVFNDGKIVEDDTKDNVLKNKDKLMMSDIIRDDYLEK